MTRDQQLTSFGLFLQTARIEKKLSIEALSAETRIRVEVLKHLESEEHEQLPNEVFVRGFIRSYAIAVGADLEEALERYSASRVLRHVRTDRKAAAQAKQSNRFWLGLGASVGAVLLMAGLTLYFYARLNVPAEMAVDAPQKPLMEQPAVPNQTPQADENA